MSTFLNTIACRVAFTVSPGQRVERERTARSQADLLEYNQRLVQKILDSAPGYLALLDLNSRRCLYANRQTARFFGVSQEDSLQLGQSLIERAVYPEDLPVYHRWMALLNTGQENESFEAEFRMRNALGEWRWIAQRGLIFQGSGRGRSRQVLLTGNDVTESREVRDRLHFMSTHDGLTGLYNWAFFQSALEQVLQEQQFPATVFMMDVDNLKVINDTLGHDAGDELLREMGARLENAFRSGDVVARVGGDEFAAILPQVNENAAAEIARRVRACFRDSTTPSGTNLDVLSLGFCTAYNSSELVEARRHADQRMYLEKQKRKLAALMVRL